MARWSLVLALAAGLLIAAGCDTHKPPANQPVPTNAGTTPDVTPGNTGGKTEHPEHPIKPKEVSFDKNSYPVFPRADEGADPSVPAEQGGKGFTGAGWETDTDFDLLGDPRAVKGGEMRRNIADFPGNLRPEGPASNTWFNYLANGLLWESLLTQHPTTLKWIPLIASHWKFSEDRQTIWYRINPNSRWADGSPITSEDVVANWEFRMDPDLSEPSNPMTFGKFEKPVAESKYIVRVKCIQKNWRNYIYFSGMSLYPAKELKAQPVKEWLDKYNFKYMMSNGPYYGDIKDIDQTKQIISLRRRTDYWAIDCRQNVGLNNFDKLTFVVYLDDVAPFEAVKKGDIDIYQVTKAKRWVEETDFELVKRGLIQKRKIFNERPQGIAGLALNMKAPPFDSLPVRKAFALLLDRKKLLDKLMYNQYLPLNSYYPGGDYEHRDNPKNEFNPGEALQLLAEAGWKERNAKGQLVKDGKPLEVELQYDTHAFDPHLTVYQESLQQVGINLSLKYLTPETQFKLMTEKKFQMTLASWNALLYPNPETSYHSKLANVPDNNNITAIADPRIDELCAMYDKEEDQNARATYIREIDQILAQQYPYILFWYGPYYRFLYWNKFGMPDSGMPRTLDDKSIHSYWWFDPEKAKALEAARKDPNAQLPVGKVDVKVWEELRGN